MKICKHKSSYIFTSTHKIDYLADYQEEIKLSWWTTVMSIENMRIVESHIYCYPGQYLEVIKNLKLI